MAYTQLELGIQKHFLTTSYYKYKEYITPTWITHLWQYMTDCKATLEPTNHKDQYQVPRVNDFFLMDIVVQADLPHETKEIFNQMKWSVNFLRLGLHELNFVRA